MADTAANSLSSGLRNDRCLLRGRCGCHGSGARISGPPPARVRLDTFGSTLSGGRSCGFWIWVAPVNATMSPLTPETLPADWMRLRNQWVYTHAARAVLQIVALGALVFSILVEVPTDGSSQPNWALHRIAPHR